MVQSLRDPNEPSANRHGLFVGKDYFSVVLSFAGEFYQRPIRIWTVVQETFVALFGSLETSKPSDPVVLRKEGEIHRFRHRKELETQFLGSTGKYFRHP